MANTSILAAFERMWQHIVTALANKSDVGHIHSDATQSTSGFLSAEDKTQLDNGGIPIVTATSTDGVSYTATVDGITALTSGMKITIIPDINSTNVNVKLNVNGLGDKYLRMPVAYNSAASSAGALASWIGKNKPLTLEYDGTYWKTISMSRPSALYLYGTVPVASGGTGATTAEEALTNLGLTATADELNCCDGVTSNIQTQIDSLNSDKANVNHTHDDRYFTETEINNLLKVETGTVTPWNIVIEEQRCIKYGKLCTIFVRGTYDASETTPFPSQCSLFSLPWKPLNLENYPVDSIVMWHGDDPAHIRPVLEHCTYNAQYNLIVLTHNTLNCKHLSFSYTFICE